MVRDRVALAWLIPAIVLGVGGRAGAQSVSSTAAAEALFQQGRSLLMAGKPDEACPKLEESQRLDPATGTLLAMALCHEQQGRLASAWAEFADVAARSRPDGRPDRERTAGEHGAALRARLSTLMLEVPQEVADIPGLVITIDGLPIGRAAWDTAIPVDGGERVVVAAAPARLPWTTTVSVKREQDHARVPVGVPARPARLRTPPAAVVVDGPIPDQGAPAAAGGARRTMALTLLATGLAGLGAAAFLGLDARGDYRTAVATCVDGRCPQGAYERAQAARDQGNIATVIAAAGAAAALTGTTLWLWCARSGCGNGSAGGGAQLSVLPGGLSLRSRF